MAVYIRLVMLCCLTGTSVVFASVSVCLEPKKTGPCEALVPRYFYNITTCKCDKFYWGGCEENGNNFDDLTLCRTVCEQGMKTNQACSPPQELFYCKAPDPRFWYNSTSCQCEQYPSGRCGTNDNHFSTEADCYTQCGCYDCDICKLPIQPHGGGDIMCMAYIPSFGFNPQTCDCEEFIYTGCGGNANRFPTYEDCMNRCSFTCDQISKCYLPKDPGPCKALFERFYFDSMDCKCKKFNYGGCQGNENNFPKKRKCKRACKDATCPICNLPKSTGPCKGYFPRYFYNIQTCQCELFIYGGCDGNANRFETQADCEGMCGSLTCPICNLPPVRGPCKAQLPRWYYDAASCECKKFTYGGCKGNMNRFLTKGDCEGSCGGYPCPVCELPVKVGPCRAAIERWYYDQQTGTCKKFSWGGCDPNGNNFKSKKDCNKVCKGFSGTG